MEHATVQPRQLEGVVVSNAMAQTCVVVVERWKQHPKYKKAYRVRRKYKIHDPKGQCGVGDLVRFEACRPISKEKRWRFVATVHAVRMEQVGDGS